MAGSRLYFRDTTTQTTGFGTASLSAAITAEATSASLFVGDMLVTKGSADHGIVTNSLANTAAQEWYFARFISPVLQVQEIPAQNWTFANNPNENNASANALGCVGPIYVVKPNDTVKVFIRDSATQVGVEFDTNNGGRILTAAGVAVTGIEPGVDRLCYEWWAATSAQANATSRAIRYRYGGTVDPVDSVANVDCASYMEAALTDLFSAKAPRHPNVASAQLAATQRALQ